MDYGDNKLSLLYNRNIRILRDYCRSLAIIRRGIVKLFVRGYLFILLFLRILASENIAKILTTGPRLHFDMYRLRRVCAVSF